MDRRMRPVYVDAARLLAIRLAFHWAARACQTLQTSAHVAAVLRERNARLSARVCAESRHRITMPRARQRSTCAAAASAAARAALDASILVRQSRVARRALLCRENCAPSKTADRSTCVSPTAAPRHLEIAELSDLKRRKAAPNERSTQTKRMGSRRGVCSQKSSPRATTHRRPPWPAPASAPP